jgi:hypothetical protein
MDPIETHPVQTSRNAGGRVPKAVALRAYEVYRAIHGEQQALVTGDCRGGFGANELIAFLYAMTFPRDEWRRRADEAFTGMKNI